jgi:hypothetical protein
MKLRILTAPLALALMASGCNDMQFSRGAHRINQEIIRDTAWNECGARCRGDTPIHWETQRELDRTMDDLRWRTEERQEEWRFHNRQQPQPGWRPSDEGEFSTLLARTAPAVSREYRELCRRIGRTYGLSPNATLRLMEALNRAAVGDFGGIQSLGLSRESFNGAQRNGGRFIPRDLDILSRSLGVNRQRVERITERMLGALR